MLDSNRKHAYILLALIVLMGIFYWFQLRPSSARKSCLVQVDKLREQRKNPKNFVTNEEANNNYRTCFAGKGLKPEDLVK